MRFERVRGLMWRAEAHCTVWHIEGAYDTVTEILESPWVRDLQSTRAAERARWVTHHYMIYFDSAGRFEVTAESWSLMKDVRSQG